MRSSLEREVGGSNLGPVKSDTVLPTARHRCNISWNGAVLPTGAMTQRWTPPTRYTLWRNTASTMKDLILFTVKVEGKNIISAANVVNPSSKNIHN